MCAPRLLALLAGCAALAGAAFAHGLAPLGGDFARSVIGQLTPTPDPSPQGGGENGARLTSPLRGGVGGGGQIRFAQANTVDTAAPARVMSTNVCTDQLALLLARPGQLVSVSALAADARLSALHDKTAGLPTNTGRAEEVFLLHPDLVVAADYSLHALTRFVRDADIRVEEFAFAATLESIPADLRRMGALLGNEAEGERLADRTEARLAALKAAACPRRPKALVRGQNGVVQGAGTLTGSVLEAAGFENLAATLGYQGMTPFPLEMLIARQPDLLILSEPWSGTSAALADAVIDHPALKGLRRLQARRFSGDGALTCAGPFTLDAAEALARWREANLPCADGKGASGFTRAREIKT